MKAIEVKKGDKVWYRCELAVVISCSLNTVNIKRSSGIEETVSYSQIEKHERTNK